MSEIPEIVKDLALILVVAGIVTLIFKKLKQPLVLGYIMAGFVVSPHLPITMSVVDMENIHTWADIGVMFLLFSLGLDFSFKKIVKMGTSPVIAAVATIFFMMMIGIGVGHLFHWESMDSIFLGGMLAMSSTTIIYKAFDDLGLRQQRFAGLVMSVLILEDILAIVMMVMLSAIAQGSNPDGGQMLGSLLSIGFFLILWFVVGIFAIPWFLRSVRSLINNEVLLVVALGLCCLMAVLSTKAGFSSAFGAFVMGSILAETVEAERIIRLVEPVKNLFGAIFFVSVGMLVDPQILVDYAVPIIVLVLSILLGQAIFGTLSFFLSGQTVKSAMQCGFSMAQIGEFSFIIASMGLSLGVISKFLYPVVVAVSVITTFLTPYMIRAANPVYGLLSRHLPKSWVKVLNQITLGSHSAPSTDNKWKSLLGQMLRVTVIYSILSVAVIALMLTFFLPFVRGFFPTWEGHWYANAICGVLTVLFISPFLRAMVMKKNRSEEFKALWAENTSNRIPLILTIVGRVILACMFLFYIVNYLSRFSNAIIISIALFLIILMIFSRRLKKGSIQMERMFVHNLQSREIAAQVSGRLRPLYEGRLLDRDVHMADFDVPMDTQWMGRSLKELGFGKKYGIHVTSIYRAHHRLNIPDGEYTIFPGDRLQIIGSDEQLKVFSKAVNEEVFGDDPDYEDREMHLQQILLREGCEFVGKTIALSGIRDKYNCLVIGVEEGEESLSPLEASRMLMPDDILWVVGERADLELLKKAALPVRQS